MFSGLKVSTVIQLNVFYNAYRMAGEDQGDPVFVSVQGQGNIFGLFLHGVGLGVKPVNEQIENVVDLILEEVQQTFGGRRVIAMIGGFHLMGAAGPDSMRESEQEVRALASKLRAMQVDKIYTGHCTGTKAFPILKEELGEKLELLVTGRTIEI